MKALGLLEIYKNLLLDGTTLMDSDIDEAITELEELENRNCTNCNNYENSLYDDFSFYCTEGIECPSNVLSTFCCNKWIKK